MLNLLTGWLLFAALAIVLGAVLARWVLLGAPLPGVGEEASVRRRLRRQAGAVGLGASLVGVVAVALVLLRQLLEFRDPFVPWSEELEFLLSTPWGGHWLRAAAASAVLPIAFGISRRWDRLGWVLATGIVLFLAAFPGFTGHAAAGELRSWTLAADFVHVVAMGGWIGTLSFVLALDRAARRAGEAPLLATLVGRFSPLAMGSVAVLVLTGAFAAWVHVGDVGMLLESDYGRTLLLKMILVLGVLALGAVNYRRLTPRLGEESGRQAMRRSATAELLLAAAVLAATAVLVRTSPM